MFVPKAIPEITVPVTVHVPGDDEPTTFQATWCLHPVSKAREIMEQQRQGELDDDALVHQDLRGLKGIGDASGNERAFTPELINELLEIPYVRRPLVMSWFAAQNGHAEAAAKN